MASVLVFFLIVLFCVMVSRGFPFWMALVLLVPAGLCVAGLYYFSMGTSADLSERFFRRFRREQPKPDEISIVKEKPEPAVEVTDEKRLDPTVAISEVIPGDPAPETQILENALSTVYTYIIGKTKCDGIQNQMRLFGGRVSPKRKATKISHTHTKKHRSNGF